VSTATATATRPQEPTLATRYSTHLQLAAFAALSLFAALHWITLVVQPPGGKAFLAVVVATGGGAALAALRRLHGGRALTAALAALVVLATLVLALVSVGLPARVLLPNHLSELFDGLDRGLVGISHVSWPYDGPDPWVRLTLLLGIPALLVPAAALAFWPASLGAGVRRALALAAECPRACAGGGGGGSGGSAGGASCGPSRLRPALVGLHLLEPLRRRQEHQLRLEPLLRAPRLAA
jgi:hypothetical protein